MHDTEKRGPQRGEIWDIGSWEGLEYLGIGFDFIQTKYMIFKNGETFFVLEKDEFWWGDTEVKKHEDKSN